MKKTLARLAMFALPMLIASCGGVDEIFGPTDAGTGACPANTGTIFRVADGVYPAVSGSAAVLSDTCQIGVTAKDLESSRKIGNDGAGNVTVSSSDNTVVVGSGPVRCNTSTITAGPTTISDGTCRFTANYSTQIVITADNAFTITVQQTRTQIASETGMTCKQTEGCKVSYKVSQKQ